MDKRSILVDVVILFVCAASFGFGWWLGHWAGTQEKIANKKVEVEQKIGIPTKQYTLHLAEAMKVLIQQRQEIDRLFELNDRANNTIDRLMERLREARNE